MENLCKILVIEDNPEHLKDVKRSLNERKSFMSASYTSNLEDALKMLNTEKYDGILSDAHFPKTENGAEELSGIDMMDYAIHHKLPITFVTSTYHYDRKTDRKTQRLRNKILLHGTAISLVYNLIGKYKNWDEGIHKLLEFIDKAKNGEIKYSVVPKTESPVEGVTPEHTRIDFIYK